MFHFTIDQLKVNCVDILSEFNDKLLARIENLLPSQLFIYSREGRDLLTIITFDNDQLYDARGNIVYSKWNDNKVVVMSQSGKVITTNAQKINPRNLSMSNDGIIYLTDDKTGVYQSKDDGVSWSLYRCIIYFASCSRAHLCALMQICKRTRSHIQIIAQCFFNIRSIML